MLMTRAEIMQRLHQMVDQLESFPEDWLQEGLYPLHKVTFASVRDDTEEQLTLVVGIEPAEDR